MLALIAAFIIDGSTPSPSPSPAALAPLPDGTYTYAIRQGTASLGSAVISIVPKIALRIPPG